MSELEDDEEKRLEEVTELADEMFDDGVWQNSKERMKDMSKRESSRHMFRLGFFMYSQYMNEQMKEAAKEMGNMKREDIEKMIDNFKENREDKK